MASNSVEVKFKVTEDGGLAKVGNEANKTSDKLKNAGKSAGEYGRNMKGAAGATSNGTKEFGKMAQGMGGLVGAYATLAANVFALSSAYEFFKRAADVRLLEKSQLSFAQTTGRALQTVTQQLRDASDGMLGFREAAEAAAIGAAKGFSPKQLEELAVGAKKASAALGRGFEDSFDRLIRGASKAEPELLDELGITLKLADATEKYADAIGTKADALTASQRSQAVLLETQRQLTAMYGDVEVGNNAFVELGKTFSDLLRKATDFIMPVAEFIANILNKSAVAAITIFGALGVSILKMVIPMDSVKQGFADMAEKANNSLKKTEAQLDSYKNKIKSVAAEQARAATASAKTSARGMLGAGVGQGSKLIQKAAKGQLTDPKQIGQLKAMLKKAEAEYKRHGKIRNGVLEGANLQMIQNMQRSMKAMEGPSYTFFQKQGMRFQMMGLQGKKAFATLKVAAVGTFKAMGRAAKVAGRAMDKALRFAGIVGMIMLIWDLVQQVLKAPLSLAKTILGAIDTVVTFLFKGIGMAAGVVGDVYDSIISGISTVLSKVTNLIVKGIDGAINGVKSGMNTILGLYNKAAVFLGMEPIQLFDTNSSTIKDLVGTFGTVESNLGDTFRSIGNVESTFFEGMLDHIKINGKSLNELGTAYENHQEMLEKSKKQYENLSEILNKSKDDIDNVVKGYDKLATARAADIAKAKEEGKTAKDLAKINSKFDIKKASMAAQAVADLDVGSRFADAQFIKDPETQAKAIALIKKELQGVGAISGKLKTLIDSGDIAGIEAFTRTQREAIASSKAVKDAVSTTNDAISSGNWYSAATALKAMNAESALAAKGFREQGTAAGEEAAQGMEKFTESALRSAEGTKAITANVTELIRVMEMLQKSALTNTLLAGPLKEIRDAQQKTAEQTLKVAEAKQKMENATDADKERLTKEYDLAKLQLKVLQAQEAYKTQGKFGGAASASSVMMESAIPTLNSDDAKLSEKVALLGNVMNPMVENLKSLGPQGEAVAAAIEGSMLVAESWATAFEKMNAEGATTGDKISAGLQAGLATVSAMSSMMAAKSKAAIKGIDNEIEAEKKRDGKSAQSLAKLQQLEARKEKMKRKAFEQDKKMKMAEVVMATGVAIMNSVKMGLPWGAVFGAMAAAMGAAQLSAISSMTYDGGGSTPTQPSAIAVGSRNNTVDLAKANSPAGELAYARGQQGTGNGMTNFTPAFTGYRASGGNTAFMVGEQGPELFVPDRPGNIVPADETAQPTAPVNVNFSISAIDSTGVEDMLTAQRGNIIGMIRQAANAHGETFLETVDESTYYTE